VDKLTLAAFEATLRGPRPPAYDALHVDVTMLRRRAESMAAALAERGVPAVAVDSAGAVGGGGAPGLELSGAAVALPEPYAARLRSGDPVVVGRVEGGRCLLDLRCVPAECDGDLRAAVFAVFAVAG